jgi:hypothetical protein
MFRRFSLIISSLSISSLLAVQSTIASVAAEASLEEKKAPATAGDKIEEKVETRFEAKTAGNSDAKSDGKAEAKTDAKADAKPDAKTDTKSDAKGDGKAEAKGEGKAEAKGEGKAEAPGQKSHAEIVMLMRGAKVIDPSYKLTVVVSDDQILVTTQKKAKASDSELKIQSVLLSKIAFEAVPSGPQRVQLTFFDFDTDGYSQVVVKRAEVMLFGEGKLSQKDLFTSLEVKSSGALEETSASTAVAAGPLQPDRLLALGRIERLKKRGTNVSGFQKLFDQIETSAKQDQKEETSKELSDLNRRLKDQEDVLKALADRKKGAPVSVSGAARSSHGAQAAQSQTANSKTGANNPYGASASLGSLLGSAGNSSAQNLAAPSPGDDRATAEGKQMFLVWETLAEPYVSTYPPDMRASVSHVHFQMSILKTHGYPVTAEFQALAEVRGLVEHWQINEARKLLGKISTRVDDLYRQLNQQQQLPHQ